MTNLNGDIPKTAIIQMDERKWKEFLQEKFSCQTSSEEK